MNEREIFDANSDIYNRYITEREKNQPDMVEIEQKRVQKLPEIVRGKHGIFTLKKRVGDIAIFQKIASLASPWIPEMRPVSYEYYEVIKVKKMDNKKLLAAMNKGLGTSYNIEDAPDIKEFYPTDEEFGSRGWAFRTWKSAENKFNELLKLEEDKVNAE